MSNLFLTPSKIINGENALVEASASIAQMGKKALIVSDAMMSKLGNIDKVIDVLNKNGLEYSVYAEINSEPNDIMIINGVEQFNKDNCDFLIAIGGGSPIDSMKAISMMSTVGGEIASYMGKEITDKLKNMVAIPTTAGTGSEATQFTIISDTKTEVKMLLKGGSLLPNLAIIDPQFTMTAPPAITAATGVDALTHAVEAYTSKKAQPMSDTFALSATKRVFENLKTAYTTPNDVKARTQMSIASLEAGIAFNNSSVTIVHGMSRPIGALFHIPHGLSNAMLLEVCLKYIVDGAIDRFADLAKHCGMIGVEADDKTAAQCFIDNVVKLLAELNIQTLEEFGVDKADFMSRVEKMAKDAFESGSPSNTRKEIGTKDMEKIYGLLW